MDGIFGVGVAEVIIVVLAMFVIGGPENTAKWAREAGRWVRKARQAWGQMVAEMENELGPEGKELMDVTRELGKGARDMRNMSSTRRLMGETMRMVEDSVKVSGDQPAPADVANAIPAVSSNGSSNGTAPANAAANGTGSSEDSSAQDSDSKYRAWLPPDSQE